MKKKRSDSSNIIFEKLDQNDFSMEKIFEELKSIPDKDQIKEISVSKYFKGKKRSYSHSSIAKPDQEIDLHGKTREESILIVQNFVMTCYKNKISSGLIITGKGRNSGEKGPVLNREVRIWLEQNGDQYLNDFYDAPPRFGGSGAIWLNFKKNSN